MFQRLIPSMILACTLTLTLPGNGHADEAPKSPVQIEVIGVGDIPNDVVEAVCLHVESNLKTQVVRRPPAELTGKEGLVSEQSVLAPMVASNTYALVALIMPSPDVTRPYVRVMPEERLGLINARGLKPAEDDPVRYHARLKKEAIAAIAALAGLSPNPAPDCATYRYRNDLELDMKGGNLSPPQWLQFEQAAVSARLVGHEKD